MPRTKASVNACPSVRIAAAAADLSVFIFIHRTRFKTCRMTSCENRFFFFLFTVYDSSRRFFYTFEIDVAFCAVDACFVRTYVTDRISKFPSLVISNGFRACAIIKYVFIFIFYYYIFFFLRGGGVNETPYFIYNAL